METPLARGTLKLNIDGSANENSGKGGVGGVFKSHERNWVLGYCIHLPLTIPTMAEMLALKHGLTIAKANSFQHINIKTDSIALILMLEKDHPSYHNILSECRLLMRELHIPTTTKIYREQNVVAFAFAKEGARLMQLEPKHYQQMPHFVAPHVQADREDVCFNRRIKNSSILLQGRDVTPNNIFEAPTTAGGTNCMLR